MPMNTPFILLDCLNAVTGYDDKAEKSLYSTLVRKNGDVLTVFMAGKEVAVGTWKEIKESVRDAKFCKVVFAIAKIEGEYEVVRFDLSGCSVGGWFSFVEEVGGINELEGDVAVAVGDTEYGKKGKVEFETPIFKIVAKSLTDEAVKKADDAEAKLQSYLEEYLKGGGKESPSEDAGPSDEQDDTTPPPFDPGDTSLDEEPPF